MAGGAVETVKSATLGRRLDIKICQTDTLILASIMEPDITATDINVLIEPQSISVEITKDDVENPVIAGRLFGTVEKGHCRVRLKDDSVMIKLRKTVPGRWKSILQEASTDLKRVTPQTRVRPQQGNLENSEKEPIEPSVFTVPLPTRETMAPEDEALMNKAMTKQDDNVIQGVMENIKKFHQGLFYDPTRFFSKVDLECDSDDDNADIRDETNMTTVMDRSLLPNNPSDYPAPNEFVDLDNTETEGARDSPIKLSDDPLLQRAQLLLTEQRLV